MPDRIEDSIPLTSTNKQSKFPNFAYCVNVLPDIFSSFFLILYFDYQCRSGLFGAVLNFDDVYLSQ